VTFLIISSFAITNFMTELKEMRSCPSCKAGIEMIVNPENISGDSVCICSECLTLIVAEEGSLRKMTLAEVYEEYKILKRRCQVEISDVLVVKLKWVRQAMHRMQAELAQLN
jgi:hypothetical protein